MASRSKSVNNLDEVRTWCSDALHDLVGFANSALASYLISVATRRGSSPADILNVLREGSVEPLTGGQAALEQFASQLYARCARSTPSGAGVGNVAARTGSQQQQQQQPRRTNNAELIKKAATYQLLDDDDDDDGDSNNHDDINKQDGARTKKQQGASVVTASTLASRSKTSSSSRNKHDDKKERNKEKKKRRRTQRRHESSSEDSDMDGSNENNNTSVVRSRLAERRYHRAQQAEKDDNETKMLSVEEKAELERDRDLRERDEFTKRLTERDNAKTRVETATSERDNDQAQQKRWDTEQRLARGETIVDEATGGTVTLDKMREQSRRTYLKKREERELTLLKQSLEDEEDLFHGAKLSKQEKKRIELGKQILSMAKDRNEDSEEDRNDGFYRLPDEYKESGTKADQDRALLTSRYVEEKQEKTEQEMWEESQTKKAGGVSRTKKREKKASEQEKEYDLVFEDQIDFVVQDTKKVYDNRDEKRSSRRKNREGSDALSEGGSVHSDEKNCVLEKRPLTAHEKILAGRKKLPVFPYREEFLAAVKDHQVLILVGETGSGKTTQIPQFLHEIGYSELGKIGCTQPRRVAAMSVAARVATEMDVGLGHEVGYSIRFENRTGPKTIIQYMTDGMLLREILNEPDLASYSCLIIDEAHERTLHTDILFGLVKDIVRFRQDLKLVISSATLDAEKFSKYFDDASIFMIPGRMFPVDIYYTKSPEADYVDAAVVTILQIHVSQPLNGDILVFLTGQEEIETCAEILTLRSRNLGSRIKELIICPIYANLPSEQQAKIFDKTPKGARKVVIATNIAETSLTIDGICYVIDTGFNKQKSFNARSGMESLVVTPVSQAAANQRSGRAGRTQPGKCFRLFTAWSFQNELDANTVPEIMRTNMGNVVLMLKSLGINDLLHFDFMDSPPSDSLIRALEQLYALGALNDRGELTKLGRRMAEFPLEPMLSKSVIASETYGCVSEVLSTVAMLSLGASVFYRPKEKAVHADTARLNFARGGGGDHISLLRCYSEWAATDFSAQWCFENYVQVKNIKKARDIREQLEGLCERVEIDKTTSKPDDTDAVLKAITAGFFYNTAKLGRSGDYQTVKQHKTVYIHPSSVLAKEDEPPLWLVYFELAFTTKEYMRQVAPIKPDWLLELAPHYYQEGDVEDTQTKKMPKSRKTGR